MRGKSPTSKIVHEDSLGTEWMVSWPGVQGRSCGKSYRAWQCSHDPEVIVIRTAAYRKEVGPSVDAKVRPAIVAAINSARGTRS